MNVTDKTRYLIESELEKHGSYAGNTVGASMRPLFKTHRDAVVLKKPDREIKKYDVVLYATENHEKYILHRVIKIKGNTLIIRGDNTFKKEYVDKSGIIAYLVSFNRKGKHHETEELGYKLYSRLWNFIYPLRWIFHAAASVLKKILKKVAPVKK